MLPRVSSWTSLIVWEEFLDISRSLLCVGSGSRKEKEGLQLLHNKRQIPFCRQALFAAWMQSAALNTQKWSSYAVVGLRSGENTRLPLCPGFDYQTGRQMWLELELVGLFVFSPGTPVFPSSHKPTFDLKWFAHLLRWRNLEISRELCFEGKIPKQEKQKAKKFVRQQNVNREKQMHNFKVKISLNHSEYLFKKVIKQETEVIPEGCKCVNANLPQTPKAV